MSYEEDEVQGEAFQPELPDFFALLEVARSRQDEQGDMVVGGGVGGRAETCINSWNGQYGFAGPDLSGVWLREDIPRKFCLSLGFFKLL